MHNSHPFICPGKDVQHICWNIQFNSDVCTGRPCTTPPRCKDSGFYLKRIVPAGCAVTYIRQWICIRGKPLSQASKNYTKDLAWALRLKGQLVPDHSKSHNLGSTREGRRHERTCAHARGGGFIPVSGTPQEWNHWAYGWQRRVKQHE